MSVRYLCDSMNSGVCGDSRSCFPDMVRLTRLILAAFTATWLLCAQEPNPAQKSVGLQPEPGMPTAIFRIQVVSRSTPAVNYLHLGGATKINFEGTPLMASGSG